MEKIIVRCDCGKAYGVAGADIGKRFRCKECGAVLIVEDSSVESHSPVPVRAGSEVRGRSGAHGLSGRARSGASRRKPTEKPQSSGSSKAVWIGGGIAAVALSVVLVLVLGGGGGKGENEAASNTTEDRTTPEETITRAETPPEPDPKALALQEFERLAKNARESGDGESFAAAFALAEREEDLVSKGALADLARVWIRHDSGAAKPNEILGNRYVESAGRWMSESELKELETSQRKNDEFNKLCRKLIDEELEDNVGKEKTKFDFYYDTEVVPRPYLIAVENDGVTTTEIVAKEVGLKSLTVLYEKFRREYEGLFETPDIDRPVPVHVFLSDEGYEKWRQDGREHLPSTDRAAGFYSPSWDGRGILHVWRSSKKNPGIDAKAVYFHEGTHQLMDYYKTTWASRSGTTPWFQEGIAEFWGGLEVVVRDSKLETLIGKPNPERMSPCRRWAYEENRVPVRKIVEIDYDSFWPAMWGPDRDKPESAQIVSNCYAIGWVLLNFCFNSLDDQYREGMRDYLKKELSGSGGAEAFAKSLQLETDEDWEFFEQELADYILGDLSKQASGR